MPDIILPNLMLELPDVGGDQDTWGDILNDNLRILDNAVTLGSVSKTLSNVNVTLTTEEAAKAVINLSGTLTANVDVIVPDSPVRPYLVRNDTTGAFTVTVKTAMGTGVAVLQGGTALVYSNGTNVLQGANAISGSFTAGNLSYTGTLTGGTGIVNIGSGQIYKDALGNVGIGTATPAYKLTVEGVLASKRIGANQFIALSTNAGEGFLDTLNNISADYLPITFRQTSTAGTLTRLTIDPAGNAGLGVTPSAWGGGFKVLQYLGGAIGGNDPVTNSYLFQNVYFDTAFRYVGSSQASYLQQANGSFRFFTAPTGTAGAPITFTQAMTLGDNAALNVLGQVTAQAHEAVNTPQSFALNGGASLSYNGAGVAVIRAYSNSSGMGVGQINFNLAGTQAMTLTQGGNNLLGTTSDGLARHRVEVGTQTYIYEGLNAGTAVYRVLANGNVQNTNNSYGAISDAKLKENVTDAGSYLERFMQVRFRNYNLIGDTLKQFGVIAQELETVFPGLVDETPDTEEVTLTRTVEVPAVLDEEGNEFTPATTREEEYTERQPTGTVTKSVKYSVLAQIQGKVIQEQQEIIEFQQQQIQDILARLTALEAK